MFSARALWLHLLVLFISFIFCWKAGHCNGQTTSSEPIYVSSIFDDINSFLPTTSAVDGDDEDYEYTSSVDILLQSTNSLYLMSGSFTSTTFSAASVQSSAPNSGYKSDVVTFQTLPTSSEIFTFSTNSFLSTSIQFISDGEFSTSNDGGLFLPISTLELMPTTVTFTSAALDSMFSKTTSEDGSTTVSLLPSSTVFDAISLSFQSQFLSTYTDVEGVSSMINNMYSPSANGILPTPFSPFDISTTSTVSYVSPTSFSSFDISTTSTVSYVSPTSFSSFDISTTSTVSYVSPTSFSSFKISTISTVSPTPFSSFDISTTSTVNNVSSLLSSGSDTSSVSVTNDFPSSSISFIIESIPPIATSFITLISPSTTITESLVISGTFSSILYSFFVSSLFYSSTKVEMTTSFSTVLSTNSILHNFSLLPIASATELTLNSPSSLFSTLPSFLVSSSYSHVPVLTTIGSTSPFISPTPVTTIPVVMVTVVNATTLLVVWSSVSEASGYIIIISDSGVRQKRDGNLEIRVERDITRYIVSGLRPYTTYSIQVGIIDMNNAIKQLSNPFSIRTNEAIPSPPVNVTWRDIGNGLINVSWLTPVYSNGLITTYIVTVVEPDRSPYQYNVSGILSLIIRKPASDNFYITLSAVNNVGTSESMNATMIPAVDGATPAVSKLSGGAIAGIVIICIIFTIILIAAVLLLIVFVWRKWDTGGVDKKVGEMEYKTDFERSTNTSVTCLEESDGGSASQLTAKRWMRANANYSTPSALLPSIADLVRSYSTAEDLVTNKTIGRPQANGLGTISETPRCVADSTNSSSERSRDPPSTLSSVCSKNNLEVNKVQVTLSYEPPTLSEREAGMRESEIADGNHPLFEMMENIYVPDSFDFESLRQYHLVTTLLDVKEQVGIGEHCKVFSGIAELLPFERNEDVVAVKMPKDDIQEDDFLSAAHILSQFSHSNVIDLLAVTFSPPMVILPFMELADLKKYLVRVRRRTRLEHQPCNFDIRDQLNISLQVASGMEYLSSKFYIHRALQSKYVLLDEDFQVKITGFQMSLVLGRPEKFQELKAKDKLPAKWLSLETLIDGRFTPYTDIWSFGVVMWEIFAYGLTPFRGVQNNEVVHHLRNGERLNKPSDCSEDIYTLMLHCWNERCRERPTFSELRQHLTGILDAKRRIMEQDKDESQNNSEFNIFDFQGVHFADSQNVTSTTEEGAIMNQSQPNFDPVESTSDVEMTVVLRNNVSTSVRNEEQSRDSNQSSIPELVLSNQPMRLESEADFSTAQLLSTEEYTVL